MAEKSFRVYVRGHRTPEDSVGRDRMLHRVEDYLSKPTRYKVWRADKDEPDAFTTQSRARAKVRLLTRAMKPGHRVRIAREPTSALTSRQLVVFKVVKEHAGADGEVPDLGCNPQIEKAHAALWAHFGEDQLRSAGRFVCKCVDQPGPCVVSRHGYVDHTGAVQWDGAAEDVFGEGPLNSMDGLGEIARFLIHGHKAGDYKLRRIIVGDRSWTPDGGWVPYTGDFHSHVHYEADGGVPCK